MPKQRKKSRKLSFIPDNHARHIVTNARKKMLFRKAHDLCVQSNCSVFLKIKDNTLDKTYVFSTDDFYADYATTGLHHPGITESRITAANIDSGVWDDLSETPSNIQQPGHVLRNNTIFPGAVPTLIHDGGTSEVITEEFVPLNFFDANSVNSKDVVNSTDTSSTKKRQTDHNYTGSTLKMVPQQLQTVPSCVSIKPGPVPRAAFIPNQSGFENNLLQRPGLLTIPFRFGVPIPQECPASRSRTGSSKTPLRSKPTRKTARAVKEKTSPSQRKLQRGQKTEVVRCPHDARCQVCKSRYGDEQLAEVYKQWAFCNGTCGLWFHSKCIPHGHPKPYTGRKAKWICMYCKT